MKDTEFLKNNLIAFKGIYDNKEVYENSLEAFKKAIKENYLIHLKLRLTKDNIIVVFSDASLTRMINLKDKINTLTYNELLFLAPYHVPTDRKSVV